MIIPIILSTEALLQQLFMTTPECEFYIKVTVFGVNLNIFFHVIEQVFTFSGFQFSFVNYEAKVYLHNVSRFQINLFDMFYNIVTPC